MSVYINPSSRPGTDSNIEKAPEMFFILRWWSSAVRSWQRRKMIAALAGLDDRILLDIGLCRAEIEDFVDGLSNAELRMTPVAPSSRQGCRTRPTPIGAGPRKARLEDGRRALAALFLPIQHQGGGK